MASSLLRELVESESKKHLLVQYCDPALDFLSAFGDFGAILRHGRDQHGPEHVD